VVINVEKCAGGAVGGKVIHAVTLKSMVIQFKKPPPETRTEWILVTRDGNQIMTMAGSDLQTRIGGFGDTAAAALRNLTRMEAENYPMPGIAAQAGRA
jgi:hypothetical protein